MVHANGYVTYAVYTVALHNQLVCGGTICIHVDMHHFCLHSCCYTLPKWCEMQAFVYSSLATFHRQIHTYIVLLGFITFWRVGKMLLGSIRWKPLSNVDWNPCNKFWYAFSVSCASRGFDYLDLGQPRHMRNKRACPITLGIILRSFWYKLLKLHHCDGCR